MRISASVVGLGILLTGGACGGDPRVVLEERDGLLFATEIEDARAPGLGG